MISLISVNVFSDAIAAFLLLLTYVSVSLDKNKQRYDLYFSFASFFAMLYCLTDIGFQFVNGKPKYADICLVLSVFSFVLAYYITALISGYLLNVTGVERIKKRRLFLSYLIGGIIWSVGLIILVSTNKVFGINGGDYLRYDFWPYAVAYPLICMFVNCFVIVFSKAQTRIRLSFGLFCLVPAVSVMLSYFVVGYSLVPIIFVICGQILYVNIHVEKSKQLYEKNMELQTRQTESMISQIQPHFLYNCITSCVALCRIDPNKAAQTMANFGKYLRVNLDTFKQKKPIPFERELEHINVYLDLEKVRFDEKLNIEYNINTVDFSVPALSVQPLVENAGAGSIFIKQRGMYRVDASKFSCDAYDYLAGKKGSENLFNGEYMEQYSWAEYLKDKFYNN